MISYISKDLKISFQPSHLGKNNPKFVYTKSLVNADSFYANFITTTFQKIPIPHLTRTMKQKFLH